MHIASPIRRPEDRPARPASQRGVALAVVLFAIVALGSALWLSQHGVTLACAGDLATDCGLP